MPPSISALSKPRTLLEALDAAAFGAELARGVERLSGPLSDFETALRAGPGPIATARFQKALTKTDYFKGYIARQEAEGFLTASVKAQSLVQAAGMALLYYLVPLFEESLRYSEPTRKRILKFVPAHAVGLPTGQEFPANVRAAVQVEAFRAVRPFIQKVLSLCTNHEIRALWNVDPLPRYESAEGKPHTMPGKGPYSWHLFASAVVGPLSICGQVFEHLVSCRWVRRRLAEDPALIDLFAEADLLDFFRLQVVQEAGSDWTPWASLPHAEFGMKHLIFHALSENVQPYLAYSKAIDRPTVLPDLTTVYNSENPVSDMVDQGYLLAGYRLEHGLETKEDNTCRAATAHLRMFSTIGYLINPGFFTDNMQPHELDETLLGRHFAVEKKVDCCDHCAAVRSMDDLKRCSQCKSARYCSQVCQKAAWLAHKQTCMPKE